jgi:hypothetical protein
MRTCFIQAKSKLCGIANLGQTAIYLLRRVRNVTY